jgi:hypothetical protein
MLSAILYYVHGGGSGSVACGTAYGIIYACTLVAPPLTDEKTNL